MKSALALHRTICRQSAQLTITDWQRPADWLAMPDIAVGEQKVYALVAVFNYTDINYAAVLVEGGFTVDWGDGVVENFASGTVVGHQFNYSTLPGASYCSRGYKQALVTITPQAGMNLTKVNFNALPPQFTGLISSSTMSTQWLDIKLRGTEISMFAMDAGGGKYTPYLERVNFLGTNKCTNLTNCFYGCSALEEVAIDTSLATSHTGMFKYCYSLQKAPILDLSNSLSTNSMFYSCGRLVSVPAYNTPKLENTVYMFSYCTSLESVPLFDTSQVTNMVYMFYFCSALKSIPLFNTGKVLSMSYAFSQCRSLKTIPLLNTSKVQSFENMFNGCLSLQEIPALDTAEGTSFSGFLSACSSLKNAPISNLPKATNLASMFSDCSSLSEIPNINAPLATEMSTMFGGCVSLKKIGALTFSSVLPSYNYLFSGCRSLLEIPAIDMANHSGSASPIGTNASLRKSGIQNLKVSHSYSGALLTAAELVEIFTNLPVVTGKTLTITNTLGRLGLTAEQRAIATDKGWTLSG